MAMRGSQVCQQLKGARAWLGVALRKRPGKVEINGVNLREAVTTLPASGTMLRRAAFAKFTPQFGVVQANVLGTSVVIGPSSDKICQKIIGRGYGRSGRFLRRGIGGFYDSRLAFAMFHQPARQPRGSVLFHH
jgi:hypothetical protein